MNAFHLKIRLCQGRVLPDLEAPILGQSVGGPETLLTWLETQLGLAFPRPPFVNRVTELASILDRDADNHPSWKASLEADRWATAKMLLNLRDELRMEGWTAAAGCNVKAPFHDLARLESDHPTIFTSTSERLRDILTALDSGQQLPPHTIELADQLESWPKLWRDVLGRLTLTSSPTPATEAPAGTSLANALDFSAKGAIEPDPSFRLITTRSDASACEYLTQLFVQHQGSLEKTVVLCESDLLAIRLDGYLRNAGLPTMGALITSPAHPILQILPLSLLLLMEPVDPQLLLDFLNLPVAPLSGKVRRLLSMALSQQPGFGSPMWNEVVESFQNPQPNETEKEAEIRCSDAQKIQTWLYRTRIPRGTLLPTAHLAQHCSQVARWAMLRYQYELENGPESASTPVFQKLAGFAKSLGELLESQAEAITDPQLQRLIEEVLGEGVDFQPYPEQAGAPIRVRSLTEIDHPFDRLIWLGIATGDPVRSRWTRGQISFLESFGIHVDDGSRVLDSRRRAEESTLRKIRNEVLAVKLPSDVDKPPHPLWIQLFHRLSVVKHPPVLEEQMDPGSKQASSLFPMETQVYSKQVPPSPKPEWKNPLPSLPDRETISASDMEERLGCPLKWVLHYVAKIRPTQIAHLPEINTLKGTFCHSVLQKVLGAGGELPTPEEAKRKVMQTFEEQLPREAGPLAQPVMEIATLKLRDQLAKSAEVLVTALRKGGYQVVAMEEEIEGTALGKKLVGYIDCHVRSPQYGDAVIDFKLSSGSKYKEKLEEGKALQLATYSKALASGNPGNRFPGAAYLILSSSEFLNPSGNPLGGNDSTVSGLDLESVWKQFETALREADGWFSSGKIPVRPLQKPNQWPAGVNLILKGEDEETAEQNLCKYCDYQLICGLKEVK